MAASTPKQKAGYSIGRAKMTEDLKERLRVFWPAYRKKSNSWNHSSNRERYMVRRKEREASSHFFPIDVKYHEEMKRGIALHLLFFL